MTCPERIILKKVSLRSADHFPFPPFFFPFWLLKRSRPSGFWVFGLGAGFLWGGGFWWGFLGCVLVFGGCFLLFLFLGGSFVFGSFFSFLDALFWGFSFCLALSLLRSRRHGVIGEDLRGSPSLHLFPAFDIVKEYVRLARILSLSFHIGLSPGDPPLMPYFPPRFSLPPVKGDFESASKDDHKILGVALSRFSFLFVP